MNGDGEPEFFGQDASARRSATAAIAAKPWQRKFAAPVGTPLLADLNADGKSEIVVSVGDGHVYVLGR